MSRAAVAEVHLPEPMFFDLVLGLDAHAGDVEMNSLASVERQPGTPWHWGPELEAAVFDGVAFEIELPHVQDRLDALKAAAQVVLPGSRDPYFHAFQTIYERAARFTEHSASLLYVFAVGDNAPEASRWSLLGLWGGETVFTEERMLGWHTLINTTVFYRVLPTTVVGVETNLELKATSVERLRILPQLQHEFGQHFALQLGIGMVKQRVATDATAALRVIVR